MSHPPALVIKGRSFAVGASFRLSQTWGIAPNLSHPFAQHGRLIAMTPPDSFAVLITIAQNLVAAVAVRDNLHLRPALARQSVAMRLVSGMAVLRAFLRRLVILMALEFEWTIVDKRGEMKRPHGRKMQPKSTKLSLKGRETFRADPYHLAHGFEAKPRVNKPQDWQYGPVEIDMTKLYAQLDFLTSIAKNPAPHASRMAFRLARTYEGIIMAPRGVKRIAGYWGTQVSAFYDVMAHNIITNSRNRPPNIKPRRTHWPTVTVIW
jgi:hypothetical protein